MTPWATQIAATRASWTVGTMAPYVAEYLLRRADIVGSLPAAYVIAGIVSISVWVRVSRRFGGRDTRLAAMMFMLKIGNSLAVASGMVLAAAGSYPTSNSRPRASSACASSLAAFPASASWSARRCSRASPLGRRLETPGVELVAGS